MLLIITEVFAEAEIFEWLQWNGTAKNDWFFLLWWLIVAGWTVFSARRSWRGMSKSRTRAASATDQIKHYGAITLRLASAVLRELFADLSW